MTVTNDLSGDCAGGLALSYHLPPRAMPATTHDAMCEMEAAWYGKQFQHCACIRAGIVFEPVCVCACSARAHACEHVCMRAQVSDNTCSVAMPCCCCVRRYRGLGLFAPFFLQNTDPTPYGRSAHASMHTSVHVSTSTRMRARTCPHTDTHLVSIS